MLDNETRHDDAAPDALAPAGRGDASVASSGMDAWAEEHPWHPRVAPWVAYMAILTLAVYARQWQSWTYVPMKIAQVMVVCYLIWRWRHLVTEINWRFHWSVIPVSIALTAAWIYLNGVMHWLLPGLAASEPTFFQTLAGENVALFWLAATAHLLAMCTAVPMIEETFNRSLLLRSFHDPRTTATGILQTLCDLPLIGDWLRQTQSGKLASEQPPVFGEQFQRTPLGKLSLFGVTASTAIFMLVHAIGDWPGAVVCGVTWCILLSRTCHLGLGPVIWSHALVNVLLWIYVVTRQQWQFL